MSKGMKASPLNTREQGLTLMELMIVVAIIGILSAIGWSQYRNQLDRGIRGDAVAALTQAAGEMEKCLGRTVPNSYASCKLTNMGSGPCSDNNLNTDNNTNSIVYSPKCQWRINIINQGKSSYTLNATRNYQAADSTYQTDVLTLDHLGRKTGPWPQ